MKKAIYSWIVYGGFTAIEIWAQHLYYRVGALVGFTLSAIFWLSGWAWSASWASAIMSVSYYLADNTFGSVMGACAGLGAIVWVLTIVNLVFFILACVRNPDPAHAGNVELGHGQKHNEAIAQPQYPTQPVYGGQPQAAYPGQPQPGYDGQQPVYGGQPQHGPAH
jgi:hypothetical protein